MDILSVSISSCIAWDRFYLPPYNPSFRQFFISLKHFGASMAFLGSVVYGLFAFFHDEYLGLMPFTPTTLCLLAP